MTFILILVFGTIGGFIGEYAFDQHCVIGFLIGAAIAIALRLGALDDVLDVGDWTGSLD